MPYLLHQANHRGCQEAQQAAQSPLTAQMLQLYHAKPQGPYQGHYDYYILSTLEITDHSPEALKDQPTLLDDDLTLSMLENELRISPQNPKTPDLPFLTNKKLN